MFAHRLKLLREQHGESREDLANVLSVSISTISNYENNIRKPENDIIWCKIAKHYGTTVDYLMGCTETPKLFAADTSSHSLIFHTDETDTTQRHKNMIAERIINSNYSDEELNKIEQMLDIIVPKD